MGGMLMLDKKIVLKHLGELEDCIKQLDSHSNCSVDQLLKDYDLRWAVERGLHLAIQNVLDISEHILVSLGSVALDDYTAIIDQMGIKEVIPQDFARRIRGMAGFRNILVHDYIKMDTKRLHSHLQNDLKDFKQFAKYIAEYLKKIPA